MPAPLAARILIVDDQPALTKSLCDTLGAEGYETVGCNSGQAALEALGSTKFDLLLTDLMMPGMDGIALCQAAQKSDSNLVSILMTGAGSIASAVKAMKAGALDYITKPLELSVILAVLSRSLDVRRLRMENAELARHVAERTADLEAANRALRTSEEQLRTLANWAVQAQEDERAGLALKLHDNITQLLCAIQMRTHALLDKLPPSGAPARREATKLRDMVGNAAAEVESLSRHLRPGVLKELGLVAVLSDTTTKFAERTGVTVKLACVELPARLPIEIELTLYRILQEALKNVEQHARARHVTVQLTKPAAAVQLVIQDDGIGFDPEHHPTRRKGKGGLGLFSMRERAIAAGGVLQVKSVRRAGLAPAGTEIEVRIPLRPGRRGG
jgi:signal transduction histidine kinase